ncbi:MAG: 4Fe-4S binding protein, partial [Clostridia bacterium]|nr:4Fe-4S binding protein [Clostridia bacterium]
MAKIKGFFKKVGLWFKNHAPTKRRLIQIYTALLFNANIKGLFGKGQNTIYTGGTKNLCAPGLNCYSCPGAVAACPLGALQNALYRTNTSGAYYVIGILALLGLLFARTICGFFCPVGLGQELLYKIKTPKLKKSRYTRILSYFKYVLLIVFVIAIPILYSGIPAFCKYVCPAGTSAGILQLANVNSSYYDGLGFLFSWKFILLTVFCVLSIFIFRFFCRFICPLGAIYGFFNKFALIGVKLDREKCVDCGLCVQTCKMDIKHVGDHECINCGECISVCPTKAISWKGSKIFLHGAQTQTAEAPSIKSVLASGTTVSATAEVVESAPVAVKEDVQTVETSATQSVQDYEKKIKKRSFWLQFSAWALAIAVLIAALVYYNFFAPTAAVSSLQVGDDCPDFTLSVVYDNKGAHDEDGNKIESFNVSECKGKVTVINYWYTTCGPCVAELPSFNRVKEEYGDEIVMVAVHAYGMESDRRIQEFIDAASNDKESWSDYSITFALD